MDSYDILSMTLDEAVSCFAELSLPAFRARQVYTWMYKGVLYDEMTNIPVTLRKTLSEKCPIRLPKIKRKLVSKVDGTVKYLFELIDFQSIESVVMKYEHGYSICVSSQAGCRMGCGFCASTLRGLERNLLPSEILGQIIMAQKDLGIRISNVVMMGIGEPLDNFDNVLKFLQLVNSPDGLGIGYRHISLSTCGIVDKIKKLSEYDFPITLSISLHFTDNESRSRIMPVNKKYPIEELLRACSDYFRKTGRRISFEYTLIKGENDSKENAHALASLLKRYMGVGTPVHVNLISVNEVKERGMRSISKNGVKEFCDMLNSLNINATVRRTLGPDINASCGQLRLNEGN